MIPNDYEFCVYIAMSDVTAMRLKKECKLLMELSNATWEPFAGKDPDNPSLVEFPCYFPRGLLTDRSYFLLGHVLNAFGPEEDVRIEIRVGDEVFVRQSGIPELPKK